MTAFADPLRIVIIEPDGQGGLFHFAHQLSDALAAEGHHVTLVTADDVEFDARGASFTLLPVMRLWSRTEAIDSRRGRGRLEAQGRRIRRAYRGVRLTAAWVRVLLRVRNLRADAVIVSMIVHPHILWIATRLSGQNLVLAQICHEFDERDLEAQDRSPVARFTRSRIEALVARFDRIFFLSIATREAFVSRFRFPPDKTARIPHGRSEALRDTALQPSTLRERLGYAPDEPVLLFFGVLRPSKGLDELIEAFALSRARTSARLLIAGRGTKFFDMDALRERIRHHGLEQAVTIDNRYIPSEEAGAYFELARAVMLPYRSATASGVLHTAYVFAKPPVVTDVGGLVEDTVHEETGLVVRQGDIAGLAEAMDRLVEDEDFANWLGQAGERYSSEHFSWSKAVRIVSDCLASDLKAKRAQGALATRVS